jgi:Pyrroline-5-carboxylate reductase dimerisation
MVSQAIPLSSQKTHFLILSNTSYSHCHAGGVRVGLSRSDAVKLAAQTVKGAAEMVLSTGSSPAVLKDQGRYRFG